MPHVVLTDRENEVLLRVAKGFTLPEIAVQLNLSRHTISDYVKQIYRKLNVSSRAEAALEAQRLGLFGRGRRAQAHLLVLTSPRATRRRRVRTRPRRTAMVRSPGQRQNTCRTANLARAAGAASAHSGRYLRLC